MTTPAGVPAALPSPPHGITLSLGGLPARLRRLVLRHVTPEPSDLPGRIAIGAAVTAHLPTIAGVVLGHPVFAGDPALFLRFMPAYLALMVASLTGGLASESRSARALSWAMTAALATASAVVTWLPGPRVLEFMPVLAGGFEAAAWGAIGIWLARALRRRLARRVE